jgi:ACT domain-containing protein
MCGRRAAGRELRQARQTPAAQGVRADGWIEAGSGLLLSEAASGQEQGMRAVLTVLGVDRVGIIAAVTAVLAESNTNILDISQTIVSGLFTMIMIVDLAVANVDFRTLHDRLTQKGEVLGMEIRLQREEIFRSMHRI